MNCNYLKYTKDYTDNDLQMKFLLNDDDDDNEDDDENDGMNIQYVIIHQMRMTMIPLTTV